ncbi:MAG: hypothetical protein R3E63_04480 [Pseudomonadales bacterium]
MQDSKTTNGNEYTYWLILVLAIAACLRFYALGQNSISAEGLFNVSFCNADGWFAMTEKYTSKTGLPFMYPTLLCQFVDMTSSVDFFVRAFSSIVGVGLIFALYSLGARFLSPLTGLLAAVVVAVDYQSVLIDRSVTPYSLFALFCMAHWYFFCCVVFAENRQSTPLKVDIGQGDFSFKLCWSPDSGCHAGVLLAFWTTALLAFYTNPTVLIFFVIEGLAVIFLVDRENRKKLLRWLWLPVFLGALPYLYTLSQKINWVLKNDLLGVFWVNATSFSRVPFFSKVDAGIFYWNLLALLVSSIAIFFLFVTGKYKKRNLIFLAISTGLIACSFFSMLFIGFLDSRSFLFCWLLLALPIVEFFAYAIGSISIPWLRHGVLGICIFVVVVFQSGVNAGKSVYAGGIKKEGDRGFEWAAEIIAGDSEFMRGQRIIFTNSSLFNFYLDKLNVTQKNTILIKNSGEFGAVNPVVGRDFYYLEFYGGGGIAPSGPVYAAFSSQYQTVCVANKKRFRVTRFSTVEIPNGKPAANCSDYLKKQGSYL